MSQCRLCSETTYLSGWQLESKRCHWLDRLRAGTRVTSSSAATSRSDSLYIKSQVSDGKLSHEAVEAATEFGFHRTSFHCLRKVALW